jgi:hypothetical protein
MKTRRFIFLAGWSLVAVTGAAGLGITHLYEARFTASTHVIIGALGQLIALVGLCLLALHAEKKKSDEPHAAPPGASS